MDLFYTIYIFQIMVKLVITKLILTRGEDWALVEFQTKNDKGTCGGTFGCNVSSIVIGQRLDMS